MEEAWEAQYLALQAFLRENDGRYPSQNAAQPSERSLYFVRPVPPCRVFPSLLFYFGVLGLFIIFVCQKLYPTPVKSLFENTMRNPFFYFLKY